MARRHLSPPSASSVTYSRNFIKTAVCELRFPTLLELETNPPTKLQGKLRKSYPFYESQLVEKFSGPQEATREHHYLFRSKDKHWTVAVKSFAIAIETSKYVDFEDFFARFKEVLSSAKDLIDSDFFTRVGLRYVNAVPITDGDPQGWIRSDLIQPLVGGVLGGCKRYQCSAQGNLADGEYLFRHGFKEAGESSDAKNDDVGGQRDNREYYLDFDYSKENVEVADVESLVKQFHEINFSFFSWCIGDKARAALGEGKAKK